MCIYVCIYSHESNHVDNFISPFFQVLVITIACTITRTRANLHLICPILHTSVVTVVSETEREGGGERERVRERERERGNNDMQNALQAFSNYAASDQPTVHACTIVIIFSCAYIVSIILLYLSDRNTIGHPHSRLHVA